MGYKRYRYGTHQCAPECHICPAAEKQRRRVNMTALHSQKESRVRILKEKEEEYHENDLYEKQSNNSVHPSHPVLIYNGSCIEEELYYL